MRDADLFTPLNPETSSGQCPACAGTAVVNEWQELFSGKLKAYKNLVCDCGHWHGDTGNLGEYQYLEDIDHWIAWHHIHIEQELAELEWLTPEDFLGFVLGLQSVHSPVMSTEYRGLHHHDHSTSVIAATASGIPRFAACAALTRPLRYHGARPR